MYYISLSTAKLPSSFIFILSTIKPGRGAICRAFRPSSPPIRRGSTPRSDFASGACRIPFPVPALLHDSLLGFLKNLMLLEKLSVQILSPPEYIMWSKDCFQSNGRNGGFFIPARYPSFWEYEESFTLEVRIPSFRQRLSIRCALPAST